MFSCLFFVAAATGRTRLSSLEDEFDDDDETENMDEKMDAESDTVNLFYDFVFLSSTQDSVILV